MKLKNLESLKDEIAYLEEAEDFITKLDSTKWESENFFSIMVMKMTDEEYNGKGK